MDAKPISMHGQWSTPQAFVLAAIGAIVSLGNIWRFPYLAGEDGGSAFILLYLLCLLVFGIPIMMAAMLLGRRGRRNPAGTLAVLTAGARPASEWKWLGVLIIVAGFTVLSYYSVIAGWIIAYAFRVASGVFVNAGIMEAGTIFSALIDDPERLLAWHTIFMLMTMVIVARGVHNGLERAARCLVPALLVLLLIMVGYAMSTGSFQTGAGYYLQPDFTVLFDDFPQTFLSAAGHAFFSLGLGIGAIMMYSAYLSEQSSITQAAFIIVGVDIAVAVFAGLAIFPLIFSNGLEPSQGPELVFIALPIAFGQMPGGMLFGTLFFVLLLLVAWTSAIALLEPAVCWLIENKRMSRIRSTVAGGLMAWLLGVATILSFNYWAFPFSFAGAEQSNGIFGLLNILAANIMLPLAGLLIAIFAGWRLPTAASREELKLKDSHYALWKITIRYITPIGMVLILLDQCGQL